MICRVKGVLKHTQCLQSIELHGPLSSQSQKLLDLHLYKYHVVPSGAGGPTHPRKAITRSHQHCFCCLGECLLHCLPMLRAQHCCLLHRFVHVAMLPCCHVSPFFARDPANFAHIKSLNKVADLSDVCITAIYNNSQLILGSIASYNHESQRFLFHVASNCHMKGPSEAEGGSFLLQFLRLLGVKFSGSSLSAIS